MTECIVDRVIAEVPARPVPGAAVPQWRGEVLSHALSSASTAALALEAATVAQPPTQATQLQAEALGQPVPPIAAPGLLVEVLRRDTAAAGLVATGFDAFGDRPWPGAPRGVFTFRHDWAGPLVERLMWQTGVVRLASGNEVRQARRLVPRRSITYRVGHAGATDALLADWLADHLGRPAWWPLPHAAVQVTRAAGRGAAVLAVDMTRGLASAAVSAGWRLTGQGLQDPPADALPVLVSAVDGSQVGWQVGWQIARLAAIEDGRLWLAEPLARPVAAGTVVTPLCRGTAVDPAGLAQWVPGTVDGRVTADVAPAWPPPAALDDPRLDGLPVWPDANWRDDPAANVQAVITQQDLGPADPWVRRDDPWPVTTLQRRFLARNADEIAAWRARLWHAQGRLNGFWVPDGLAPVLQMTAAAGPDDGFLRVTEEGIAAFWHRPAACLVLHPDGLRQHALTATCQADHGGVLVLRSGLDAPVPAGSRVVRLMRGRLDHDAIDLHWHSPALVEIPLAVRQVPEPRGHELQSDGGYGGYAV